MRTFLSLVFLVVFVGNGLGASPETTIPKKLLGFFSEGKRVGIRSVEGSAHVFVHVYSEANYQTAKELSRLGRKLIDANELAEKNAAVRIALTQYLQEQEPGSSKESTVMMMPLIGTTLGQVVAAGEDYLLIEIDDPAKQRLVISESSIAKVYLDATPIRFVSRLLSP